jgi:RNA polymerase sigma-70 factor (ECF subfamily)
MVEARPAIEAIYRSESRRVLATLIRLLGDFDLAEEALQQAFVAALERWPAGMPSNPREWLISVGRFKAIDALRRRARFDRSLEELAHRLEATAALEDASELEIADDRLRLIFTCCHPALTVEAQLALTLREVCGLTTEEIARGFLARTPTIAKRIVRAKSKIRDAQIPYEIPAREDLPERIEAVLRVVYLLFTEGYAASFGEALTRPDISNEAIRLGRLLVELLPEPEVLGMCALMLLHESRRSSRVGNDGLPVLLDDQDRTRWDQALIVEGTQLAERANAGEKVGQYALQAAIAAVHAQAPDPASTNWNRIAYLYDLLLLANPTPVVGLNRAIAIAMRDGPQAGLDLVDAILAKGDLTEYYLAHSARADLLRRLGRSDEALAAYRTALKHATALPARRFLEVRLQEITRKT